MYVIKKKVSGRIKEFIYYTEYEALLYNIGYHLHPRLSFKSGHIKIGDHILTEEGLVVPVISISQKNGVITIPTNKIPNMFTSPRISIKGKDGFKFTVKETPGSKKYNAFVKNVVDVFLRNGFDPVDAYNKISGETHYKNKSQKKVRERNRAKEFFQREEVQEYLRMEAIKHFREAGISPSDILKQVYTALGKAVDKEDFDATQNLGEMMLKASGEFDMDMRPINVSVMNDYRQLPPTEDREEPIGILAESSQVGYMKSSSENDGGDHSQASSHENEKANDDINDDINDDELPDGGLIPPQPDDDF